MFFENVVKVAQICILNESGIREAFFEFLRLRKGNLVQESVVQDLEWSVIRSGSSDENKELVIRMMLLQVFVNSRKIYIFPIAPVILDVTFLDNVIC